MKIRVLVVGRVRGLLEQAVREFEGRASHYWRLEVIEVRSGAGKGRAGDPRSIRRAEGGRLRNRISADTETWALTRGGGRFSSDEFAQLLGSKAMEGSGGVTFLVGGAFGLDGALLDEVDRHLALSDMTLPHEVARLVLAEQLYRAGTILRSEPYHKARS